MPLFPQFRKNIFIAASFCYGLLLIPAFIAAFAEDEGTLPDGDSIWPAFASLFHVLRFPTHTLLWPLICLGGAGAYFAGLLVNCLLYGLLSERLLYGIRLLRKRIS